MVNGDAPHDDPAQGEPRKLTSGIILG